MSKASKITFCRVTLDDGSRVDLIQGDFARLFTACQEYTRIGEEIVFLGQEVAGGETFFYVSKVQDAFVSTPENRAAVEILREKLKEEESENRRIW